MRQQNLGAGRLLDRQSRARAPGRKQAAPRCTISSLPHQTRFVSGWRTGSGLSEKIVSSTLCATGLAAETALA
jgi:hypothetical protein